MRNGEWRIKLFPISEYYLTFQSLRITDNEATYMSRLCDLPNVNTSMSFLHLPTKTHCHSALYTCVQYTYLEFGGIHDMHPQVHVVLVTAPPCAGTHLDSIPRPLYRDNSTSITLRGEWKPNLVSILLITSRAIKNIVTNSSCYAHQI